MNKSAVISDCGAYRYELRRHWGRQGRYHSPEWYAPEANAVFIGLNPSTADATDDDATIRRCIRFAEDWGYGGLIMLNLFAYRATDPKELLGDHNIIGRENNNTIARVTEENGGDVVCCWGVGGTLDDRDIEVMHTCVVGRAQCLGLTKDGHPKHPLRLAVDTERRLFRVRKKA